MCRASGALLHISRVRSPIAARRALLFSALKPGAVASITDAQSGATARGPVTAATCASGMVVPNVANTLHLAGASSAGSSPMHGGQSIAADWQGTATGRLLWAGASEVTTHGISQQSMAQTDRQAEQGTVRNKRLPRLPQTFAERSGSKTAPLLSIVYAVERQHGTAHAPYGSLTADLHAKLQHIPIPGRPGASSITVKVSAPLLLLLRVVAGVHHTVCCTAQHHRKGSCVVTLLYVC
jgi:hypothetical protein